MTPDSNRGADNHLPTMVGPEDELAVHLQEYQMLTSRNSQWLALQNNVWFIWVAFVALLLQLIDTLDLSTILWLSFITFEAAVVAYSGIGCESYNNVVYMEAKLRPRIKELIGRADVLRYESYVQRNRSSPQWLFDYGPAAILTFVLLSALLLFDLPPGPRWLWLLVLFGLVVANWQLAWRAASIRNRIPVEPANTGLKRTPDGAA